MAFLVPLLFVSTVVSTRETIRAKDKQKKAQAFAEQRQQEALDKSAKEEARKKALASEAPKSEADKRRRRIGLQSLRVDPGVSFGAGGGVGGGVGGGLKL